MPYYCMPVLHAVLLLLHLQYAMTDDSGVSDNSLHLSPPDSQHASHDTTTAFSCYTCNVRPGDDDTEQCVDEVEQCPDSSMPADGDSSGVPFRSCSTVLYFGKGTTRAVQSRAHVRKFCTSAGSADLLTPLLSRLAEQGGVGGVCQTVDSWARIASDPVLPVIAEGQARTRLLLRRMNRRRRRLQQEAAGARAARAADPMTRIGAVGPPAPPSSHASALLCVCTKSLCNSGDFQTVLGRSIFIHGLDPLGKSLKAKLVSPEGQDIP